MIFLAGYQIVLLLTDSAHCPPTIRGYHVLYSKVSFCYDIDARDSVRATPPFIVIESSNNANKIHHFHLLLMVSIYISQMFLSVVSVIYYTGLVSVKTRG